MAGDHQSSDKIDDSLQDVGDHIGQKFTFDCLDPKLLQTFRNGDVFVTHLEVDLLHGHFRSLNPRVCVVSLVGLESNLMVERSIQHKVEEQYTLVDLERISKSWIFYFITQCFMADDHQSSDKVDDKLQLVVDLKC